MKTFRWMGPTMIMKTTLARIILLIFFIHEASGALDIMDNDIMDNNITDNTVEDDSLPEKDFNVTLLAAKYGYQMQQYQVTTEDGYILALHRLPGNRSLPILLVHGLTDSSETWLLQGNISLAITLAAAGHDVWIGDCRGNMYSRGHTTLDAEKDAAAYWNFTFYEHGVYDTPAFIDFVLKETGKKKLNAIGHSQGTTVFFVLGAERPEYNDKVNLLIALAPIAYLSNVPSPLADIISIAPAIYEIGLKVKQYEVFGETAIGKAVKSICLQPIIGYSICAYGLIFPLGGSDPDEYQYSFHYELFKTYPMSTSLNNLYHLSQVSRSGNFSKFDYGSKGNLEAYRSEIPPQINLSNVTMPIALLYGRNDNLATSADVAHLREKLPNVVEYVSVPRDTMNHFDFVWGKTMDQYLYPTLFNILYNYTPK